MVLLSLYQNLRQNANTPMKRLSRGLKTEWTPTTGYLAQTQVKKDIRKYLMSYYNWRRPHQASDGLSPVNAKIGLSRCPECIETILASWIKVHFTRFALKSHIL